MDGDPCLPPATDGYPNRDTWCGDLDTNTHCWALYNCNTSCYDTETPHNNYIGLRTITGENTLYVEYQTGNLNQAAIEFDKVDFVRSFISTSTFFTMHMHTHGSHVSTSNDLA